MRMEVGAVRLLARALAVAATALGCACGGRDRLDSLPPVPDAATVFHTQYEGCAQRQVFRAARSEGEWRSVRAALGSGCDGAFADSADFGREMLLAAASGGRSYGSRDVAIERAGLLGDTLHVLVRVREPECSATTAPSSPMHVIRLPRSTAPVVFHLRREKERCD